MQNAREVLIRNEANPILEPEEMPFPCYTVMNTGAVKFGDEVLLLLRVENLARETNFHVAKSRDGIHFTVNPDPIDYPMCETEKRFGKAHRFDMRITEIEGRYIVCHAAWVIGFGCCAGMAETKDFVHFEPMPYTSLPPNRNTVLFPEKINGLYARFERPLDTDNRGGMWVGYSPDLLFWGNYMPLDKPHMSWCGYKYGAGIVPIKTEHGWLEIYHGTCMTASTENYYLGVMLLDLDDPSKVIAAPTEFILGPEQHYEQHGQTPNVVFTNGAVLMDDGTLNVYYGAADTRVCLAQTRVETLVDFCLQNGK